MTEALRGKKIMITRPLAQAASICQALKDHEAEVLLCPTIEICPPGDDDPLIEAVKQLNTYDWLLFTSVNGVRFFLQYAEKFSPDFRDTISDYSIHIGAIGPATANSLKESGLNVDLVPRSYVAEALIEAFDEQFTTLEKVRFLLPRADKSRYLLVDELMKRGAIVDNVDAYMTKAASSFPEKCLDALQSDSVDYVVFTSSSTVEAFFSILKKENVGRRRFYPVSIGPITSQTLRMLDMEPFIEATEFSIPGIVAALVQQKKLEKNQRTG